MCVAAGITGTVHTRLNLQCVSNGDPDEKVQKQRRLKLQHEFDEGRHGRLARAFYRDQEQMSGEVLQDTAETVINKDK